MSLCQSMWRARTTCRAVRWLAAIRIQERDETTKVLRANDQLIMELGQEILKLQEENHFPKDFCSGRDEDDAHRSFAKPQSSPTALPKVMPKVMTKVVTKVMEKGICICS